jgi:hypothetical protein
MNNSVEKESKLRGPHNFAWGCAAKTWQVWKASWKVRERDERYPCQKRKARLRRRTVEQLAAVARALVTRPTKPLHLDRRHTDE